MKNIAGIEIPAIIVSYASDKEDIIKIVTDEGLEIEDSIQPENLKKFFKFINKYVRCNGI